MLGEPSKGSPDRHGLFRQELLCFLGSRRDDDELDSRMQRFELGGGVPPGDGIVT
jgi:hypothetical protein